MPTIVVNCRKSKYDVYIGRPSKWGNPFIIGKDGDRNTVIEKYRVWAKKKGLNKLAKIELKNKSLGCFCSPLKCHGDVLAKWANKQAR